MAEQPNQRRWNDTISELPAFYGNDKDTLSAESLVHRVEAAATALGWDDEATFNNFSLCLRADAEKWLALTRDIRGYMVLHQTALQEGVRYQDERVQNLQNHEGYEHEALGNAHTIHGKNQRSVEND